MKQLKITDLQDGQEINIILLDETGNEITASATNGVVDFSYCRIKIDGQSSIPISIMNMGNGYHAYEKN
jgi:hypothetical protein